ncbi:hypothetical protein ACFOOM_01015 [Streptomyces echinoruber]|uniref:DUF488 domain-containing protein n=1 Tax=Streptomyces echinoruber TaxID=68898 RepID=A0A918V7N0_9ACTN|nr:hypothetical protein [Streptomyces echinoruber]GGZ73158.1 hypothetical protein GCM10010389_08310 [Streptomyces echinoruber]
MNLALATCTYQEFQPPMGAPIRTTAGHPRFPLGYELVGHAKLITPTRELLAQNLPQDAYEFSYRRILNGYGIDRIYAELAGLAARAGGARLVLLCFDKLSKPGAWCHRTHFARWWLEQTGEEIPELGDQPGTPPPSLF